MARAVGTLLLTYWLAAAATGPDAFTAAQGFIGSLVGRLLLFGWSYALFYHLCNGIRHLVWDAGYGFEIATTTRSGWAVVAASVVLTLAAWIGGYLAMGAGCDEHALAARSEEHTSELQSLMRIS